MERVKPKRLDVSNAHQYRHVIFELSADQEGEPEIEILEYGVKMVHVVGEFAGAHVEILGENVPREFDLMTDYDSVPLRFAARGHKSTDDRVTRMMPRVVGGSDRTKLTVAIIFARE